MAPFYERGSIVSRENKREKSKDLIRIKLIIIQRSKVSFKIEFI